MKKFMSAMHLTLLLQALIAPAVSAAVILQYHHVSTTLPAVTSVTPETFKSHLNYLKQNSFNVIALPELMNQLQAGNALPDNTVAITFDDGYKNNYTTAAPILAEFDFPYTIFVNPKLIDEQRNYLMTWQQLRELSKQRATIANHSAEHLYLHRKLATESDQAWQQRIKRDIQQSELRIKQETGHNYRYLAYPYGEFNQQLKQIVSELNFVGFGQHSGAVGHDSDFTQLPRFPASGVYANLETLKTKLRALPFTIKQLQNHDPVTSNRLPKLTLQLDIVDFYPQQFACYVSGLGRADLNWKTKDTVEIMTKRPLQQGRSRYNCTAPSISKKGHFYWFSQPWIVLQ